METPSKKTRRRRRRERYNLTAEEKRKLEASFENTMEACQRLLHLMMRASVWIVTG